MSFAVADASVVIALAKVGRLDLLRQVFGEVAIAPTVKVEALDRGMEISAPEVGHIRRALAERWLRVARTTATEKRRTRRLLDTTTLDAGEAESLALARSRNLVLVVDDKQARAVARAMNLEYMGTAAVLLEAFITGKLAFDELEDAVEDVARVLWLAPDIIADILRRAREARR